MNIAYLCLGGNIGNREDALKKAIWDISEKAGTIESRSQIYETEAWGIDNQQAYLNQTVKIQTELSPVELIECLLNIEKNLGRQRNFKLQYEARTLDIDILFYNDLILKEEHLIIPHPRMHLRKFVLVPLNEIAPNYLHPELNKSIFNLLKECEDHSEVKPYKAVV
ncbi:MAG: folK [Bacteroidota bacterium]|jgi:2-amino-4-hydroxy-6-hydroxymethyldihydropteridine diphosphokinase|nr:folK [Bacteroidota bacterium]